MRSARFVVCLLLAVSLPAFGQASNIVLKTEWAKKYRNRLSIEAKVTVLHVSNKETDADIHGGSRKNQIGLPMVAEILNGTEPSQAKGRSELQPGSADKTIYGAWRLWCEHPPHGGGTQCQVFDSSAPAVCQKQTLSGPDSNPDHSFEIHPVFAVNSISVARSSMVLKDNKSVKDPADAFKAYTGKKQTLTIARTATGLTLSANQIGDNYVRMKVRFRSKGDVTKRDNGTVDGGWIFADVVTDDDDEVLGRNIRVFYFLDSDPGDRLSKIKANDEVEIVAMPRLNMDVILKVSEGKTTTVIPLPVEFVAVAFLSGP